MDVAEILRTLRPLLAHSLVATDFDGTLSPLVLDPESSQAVPGSAEALTALADRGADVAVITGRDAHTALRLGGLSDVPGLSVAGLYGVETWHAGELVSPATPPEIEALRAELPGTLAGADDAVWVEDKRLSLVIHTRRTEDPGAERDRLAPAVLDLGERLGFEVHLGSDVVELRLPGFDKAGALHRLADGHRGVLYLGDDLGDLPAFAEVARLRGSGVAAFTVGVRSSGIEPVLDAADVLVDDPHAVVALLRELAS